MTWPATALILGAVWAIVAIYAVRMWGRRIAAQMTVDMAAVDAAREVGMCDPAEWPEEEA